MLVIAAAARRFACRMPHAACRMMSSSTIRVGYVTDVEGNLDFWRRFCVVSDGIDDSASSLDNLRLKDSSCHLVVGGDSVDKGPGDLRFLRSIMNLKQKFPSQVHLVLGNRDINKLRLLAELSSAHMLGADIDEGVYWRQRNGPEQQPATPCTFLSALGSPGEDTVANRLRYMLADNMGSPRAWEFRRQELAAMRHDALSAEASGDVVEPTGGSGGPKTAVAATAVSDGDVLASYLDSLLRPDGLMRSYLEHGQLAVRLGDALFVHGALHPDALGTVPAGRIGTDGRGGGARRLEDVDEWIHDLNTFASTQMREWLDDCDSGRPPTWEGANDRLGFGFFDRPGGGCAAHMRAARRLPASPDVPMCPEPARPVPSHARMHPHCAHIRQSSRADPSCRFMLLPTQPAAIRHGDDARRHQVAHRRLRLLSGGRPPDAAAPGRRS